MRWFKGRQSRQPVTQLPTPLASTIQDLPLQVPSRTTELETTPLTRATTIGLVGCVKTKRNAPTSAKDLYVSTLFNGRRNYVEAHCDRWFVLSAKHGLVLPDEVIEPYDVALSQASIPERRRWAANVVSALRAELGDLRGLTFDIHAGASYREFGLTQELARSGAKVLNPVDGLNFGQQLAF